MESKHVWLCGKSSARLLSGAALTALTLLGFVRQARAQEPVVVPAGTTIEVVLIDRLDSSRAAVGEVTRASVGDPVVLDDVVAIRKGSDALVQLARSPDGKNWYVKLTSVNVKGKDYPVTASFAEVKATGGKGAKAAKRAVGLGAVGAIIGGIAGGGKGAAIGAGSGAGLGAISGAASKGVKIDLPSETVLTFQLRAALRLE